VVYSGRDFRRRRVPGSLVATDLFIPRDSADETAVRTILRLISDLSSLRDGLSAPC
jgi:hypothetical protein